jgi:hypothetical protein
MQEQQMFRRFDRRLARIGVGLAGLLAFGQALPVFARQAAPATAKEVVARHVTAMGGEAAFKAIRSIRARGTFSMVAQGVSGEFELLAARPNKMVLRVTVTGIGRIESGYDGKVGWSIDPVSGPTVMKGRQLSETADDAVFDAPLHGADHVKELALVGNEEFDKRKAIKIKVVFQSGNEQAEFFDAETGLQIGSEGPRETPMGVVPTIGILRDYKKFQTLQMPTTLVQRVLGIEQVMQISSYEFDVVPPETFDLSPAIKALIK